MKKSTLFLIMLLTGIMVISCSQTAKTDEEEQTKEQAAEQPEATSGEIDELTYQDVVAMVYDDEGERIEWHGEEMPNELTEFLIITNGEPCGEGECGNRLALTNTSDRSITAIIRGDYDLEGDQGYIPRKYVIGAGKKFMIGCSHLCFGGKAYEFPRTIVASAYTETE
ncbi:hypothetical protein [Ekhidna sp.]|uniref:hypothetical protein n=1 Tax=Ekhidna sp. TaxID=2608089 RepID=UPI003298E527